MCLVRTEASLMSREVVARCSKGHPYLREAELSFPRATPLQEGPGPPFYRYKERIQMYNGGV
jgi:hypothetical protein